MDEINFGSRDARGNWSPKKPIDYGPAFAWPPKPRAVLKWFFANLPIELEESAQLDGATRFGIFWEIVMPLTRPGLAATTLLILVLNWNEYLFAVFLATVKVQTMPIMVAAKNTGEKGVLWWEMCAVTVVMIIPVIIMSVLLTRFISKGVLLGAVKG
ncbi:ABC transporter permease subunit [Alphaproteobacteria bacterium]|nr:ABC transporter permease subunit [Alphaproteobacteria bacterium]